MKNFPWQENVEKISRIIKNLTVKISIPLFFPQFNEKFNYFPTWIFYKILKKKINENITSVLFPRKSIPL